MIDVLVIGGGPTGLAAAIHAARLGLATTVVEPRPGPIDKACGEGLMPAAVRALERLGAVVGESRPFFGIRYLGAGAAAEARFAGGAQGLGVRRTELHRALAARARALGVEVVRGRASEVVSERDAVRAAGLRARWLIAADGLHSPIRRRLGLERRPRGAPRFGLRAHFRVAPWTDLVEVYWDARCEAYVTPVAADTVGVAILHGEPAARFDDLLARFPALRDRLGPPLARAQGAGPFHVYARRAARGRVLLVGDAAGFLDPITGEGVRLGLASAEAAIEAIAREDPEGYARAWPRLVRRYWWLTRALLAAARRPLLRRALVPLAARLPGVFGRVVDLLASDGPPSAAPAGAVTLAGAPSPSAPPLAPIAGPATGGPEGARGARSLAGMAS